MIIMVDGACQPNPGRMGFAAVLLRDEEILLEATDSQDDGTNNAAEMLAIILGLEKAVEYIQPNEEVTIVSDSNLAIGLLSGNKSSHAHLIRLRHRVRQAEKALGVTPKYVKGDREDEMFQYADALAKAAAAVDGVRQADKDMFGG